MTQNTWRNRSIALVGALALFRLWVMGRTGLGDSEAYYWTWSRHLDWSYYDHPPMTAWLIRFFNEIGSPNVFWTRLPSLLLFLGTCYLFFRIAVLVFESQETAFWALLMFNLCPIFASGALQMVPDVPAAFFWMLFVYLVIKILKEERSLLWYPAGAVAGLGLLSKYMALPLILSTLLMLAWHKEYRKHLKKPHIYLGGVLGLVCFSPVLIWNYLNYFPSFRFHLVERHVGERFSPGHMAEAIGGQALYFSPLMWFALLYVVFIIARKVFVEKDERFNVLFWLGVPPLAFFMLITLWTKESEPHWTAFGYLTLFIAWAFLYVNGKRNFRGFTAASLAVGFAIIALFYTHVFVPFLPIKPKYDITNELYGWEVAGPKIEELYNELPDESGKFVMTHHWVLSSQVAFATKSSLPVFAVTKRINQYDFFENSKPPVGANFIFVADNRFTEPPDRFYYFDRYEEPVEIKIYRGDRWARSFYIYKGYNYKGEK